MVLRFPQAPEESDGVAITNQRIGRAWHELTGVLQPSPHHPPPWRPFDATYASANTRYWNVASTWITRPTRDGF